MLPKVNSRIYLQVKQVAFRTVLRVPLIHYQTFPNHLSELFQWFGFCSGNRDLIDTQSYGRFYL